jgi:hypothetical protein
LCYENGDLTRQARDKRETDGVSALQASVINEPSKHADEGYDAVAGPAPQWDHTSMLATAKNLFGLPGFL